MRCHRLLRVACLSFLMAVVSGCPGDASDGQSPRIEFLSSPDCTFFFGGFPSGFSSLPGPGGEAAVVQLIPTAVLGLDLDQEPPRLLATGGVQNYPGVACPACSPNPSEPILGVDSDSDGIADSCRSDELGFQCLSPIAGSLTSIDSNWVALSSSNYEQIVFLDPRSSATVPVEIETPTASGSFEPADWPFWPTPGSPQIRSAISTRVCVYTQRLDSLGAALGPNRFCDDTRDGFVTRLTAGSAIAGDSLFVATSNLLRSSQARFAPGTILAFDFDQTASPPRIQPAATRSVLFTSGFNPTSITPFVTPAGRELLLVTVSGAIALGTGPDRVRSDSAIDVIDVMSRTLIATIPLGRAGLGDAGISIDPTGRIALTGSFTRREIFGVDLAVLDDPNLGSGPESLPIVLDGSIPGFRDARIFDATSPFRLPKRLDGPPDSQCATITSVAISSAEPYAVASDFCDGTLTVMDIRIPTTRTTPIDPAMLLTTRRVENVVAPIIDTATGLPRAIDRVLIRAGRPGIDFTGPDVYFTAGLPEGAVCGARINSL